eukprot:TRINITY_DN23930_c0_g1_i1.p1 TRINITY_DN23930_c0_g1~~TRINITY_DN23930_c0_g1_i1.p1  ORF type:complete len:323 (-),score=34.76 TRINITY_DN23930_c0_g1_i1:40-1008(-)
MTFWLFECVVCFSTPYVRTFVAPRLSVAYGLKILGLVGLVLFPLFVSFASDNVWLKESSYREQPTVAFSHDLFVVVSGERTADAVGWTTRSDLRPLLPPEVRVPQVRSRSVDVDHDGIPDELVLKLAIPMSKRAALSGGYRRVFLAAVYDYELRDKVKEKLGGLIVVDADAPYSATGVWLRGRLQFRQALPLRRRNDPRSVYAANPLAVDWRSNWAARHHPVTMRALLERYAQRNETVHLELMAPPVWDYSPSDEFRLELMLDVKPHLVQYVPPSVEVLKFAWMQVLSFLVPSWLFIRAVLAFAFENQIVDTYVVQQLSSRS